MIASRLTSKAQITISQPIRIASRLDEGDTVAYAIEGDRVVLTKAQLRPQRSHSTHSQNGTAPQRP